MEDKITINTPHKINQRGIIKRGYKLDTKLLMHCSVDEKSTIKKAAKEMGITMSEFIRQVSIQSAHKVLLNEL